MIQLNETKDCCGCNAWGQKCPVNGSVFGKRFHNDQEVIHNYIAKNEGLMVFLRTKIYQNIPNISIETSYYEDALSHNLTIEKSVNYHKYIFSKIMEYLI